MNENNNRIKEALSVEVYQEIHQLITQIDTLLTPFKVGLTPEERKTLPKIKVKNKAFVKDATNEMQNSSATQFVPNNFNPNHILVDLTMFEQNEAISSRLRNLTQHSDDLRILAGSEAYTSALAFKRYADSATLVGIPGASAVSAKLKERFMPNGKRTKKQSLDSKE